MKKIFILCLAVMSICCVSGPCLGISLPDVFGTTEDGVEPEDEALPDTLTSTGTPTEEFLAAPIATEQWGEIFAVTDHMAVYNGGSAPEFTLPLQGPAECTATKIRTYHWNNENGVTPGTIALQGSDGSYYGPYQASGVDGMGGVPNAYWEVFVNIPIIQQVTYTVVDSDPGTWSQNDGTSGVGMTIVWGVCGQ